MDARRLMVVVALSASAALSLAGCQGGGSQSRTTTHETVNGVDVINSETRQQDGTVSLACIASRSGQCHYRVQGLDDCRSVAGNQAQCAPDGELQVALLPGTHWEFAAGRAVTVCVSDDADKACASR